MTKPVGAVPVATTAVTLPHDGGGELARGRDEHAATPSPPQHEIESHGRDRMAFNEGNLMNVSKLVTTSLLLGAATLGAALGSTALAAPPTTTVEIAVDYADLDLTTRDGLEVLHRRIVAAARTVCPEPRNADVKLKGLARECRTQAIEGALRSIGNAELAALHAASRGRG